MPPFGSRIGSIEKADPLIDVFRNRDALTGEPLSGQWRDRSGHPEVELPLESGCFVSLLQLAHDLAAALTENAEKKEPYCQEWAEQDGSFVMLYCYPTLGRPKCYVHPLPNRQGRHSYAVPNPEI